MAVQQQVFRMIIEAKSGGAVSELKKVNGQVQKNSVGAVKAATASEKALGRMKVAAAGVGVAAGLALGKYSVNAARDLEEAINAVNVMYGKNAEAILDLSEKAATGVGLSKRAFDESAVAVGGFVNQIAAISGENTAGVLDELMTRAADFASVFNINVDEALQRFRSGLAGETEPLRRFGINLLQSEVNAYALAEGITEVGATMTEEEKVLARYELLMQKTDKMAGDFAATSGDLANQQRTLRAELENSAAEFGEQLVPAVQLAITAVTGFIEILDAIKVPWVLEQLNELFGGLSGTPFDPKSFGLDSGGSNNVNKTVDNLNALAAAQAGVVDSMGGIDSLKGLGRILGGGEGGQGAERLRTTIEALKGLQSVDASGFRQLTGDLDNLMANVEAGNPAAIEFADGLGLTSISAEDLALVLRTISNTPPPEFDWADAGMAPILDDNTKALLMQTQQGERYVAGLIAAGTANADLQTEIDDANAALEDQEQAARDARTELRKMADDTYDLWDAESDLASQIISANEVLADEESSLYEIRDALTGVARQADEVAQGHLVLAGLTADTVAGEALWIESMLTSASTLEGPLRTEVLNHISRVTGIPTSVLTEFGVEVPDLTAIENALNWAARTRYVRYEGSGSFIGPDGRRVQVGSDPFRADGGPVSGGRPYIVGERGPEMFVPAAGGSIVPNHRLNSGGGSGINVTVHAGIGTNGPEVGRQVVSAIKSYERTNGKRWRAA